MKKTMRPDQVSWVRSTYEKLSKDPDWKNLNKQEKAARLKDRVAADRQGYSPLEDLDWGGMIDDLDQAAGHPRVP